MVERRLDKKQDPCAGPYRVSVLEPKVKQDEVTGTTGSTSRKGEGLHARYRGT